MPAKTCGNVTNISEGPAEVGAPPITAKAAGTIMKPAIRETSRSKPAMRVTDDVRHSSRCTYEPYVIIIPIASDKL